MKFFFLSVHNRPSGGTKVLNQMVNLCIEKGFESYYVTAENQAQPASFMENPSPAITLDDFVNKCEKNDIVINCWQNKNTHQAVMKCSSQHKIFWQHGVHIPYDKDFDNQKIYDPNTYNQYWNVSQACANFIKKTYKLEKMEIVHPFFDDNTLLQYIDSDSKRKGILIVRRRGQEAIHDILKKFPKEKLTIMNQTFTDNSLYKELINHKYFISSDAGVNGNILTTNRFEKYSLQLTRLKNKIFGKKNLVKPMPPLLGFPMTACEAAWLGTIVIGFAMGGGLEWMTDENIYLAKDGDINSLLAKTKGAVEDSEKNHNKKRQKAFDAVKKFNKEHTWNQMTKLLNL